MATSPGWHRCERNRPPASLLSAAASGRSTGFGAASRRGRATPPTLPITSVGSEDQVDSLLSHVGSEHFAAHNRAHEYGPDQEVIDEGEVGVGPQLPAVDGPLEGLPHRVPAPAT